MYCCEKRSPLIANLLTTQEDIPASPPKACVAAWQATLREDTTSELKTGGKKRERRERERKVTFSFFFLSSLLPFLPFSLASTSAIEHMEPHQSYVVIQAYFQAKHERRR